MSKQLTSYCMQMLSLVQRLRSKLGNRAHVGDVDLIALDVGWTIFEPWTGEDEMVVASNGSRHLFDADGYMVDVTDVPLQYEVEPVKPPKFEREAIAQRIFDAWPRATAVRHSVDTMRKIDGQLVDVHVTFDTGFVLRAGPWRMDVAQRELDALLSQSDPVSRREAASEATVVTYDTHRWGPDPRVEK
jgi:hypothetical protein